MVLFPSMLISLDTVPDLGFSPEDQDFHVNCDCFEDEDQDQDEEKEEKGKGKRTRTRTRTRTIVLRMFTWLRRQDPLAE